MSNLFHGHFKYQRSFSGSIKDIILKHLIIFFGLIFVSFEMHVCVFCLQLVDINLQRRKFAGIQFVIWSGGSWINNNGANFFVGLNSYSPNGKVFSTLFSLFFIVVP